MEGFICYVSDTHTIVRAFYLNEKVQNTEMIYNADNTKKRAADITSLLSYLFILNHLILSLIFLIPLHGI